MRQKRNPAMPLVDQILLDKLESDLFIESDVYAKALLISQDEPSNHPMFVARLIANVRISSIQSQIREINEQYNLTI